MATYAQTNNVLEYKNVQGGYTALIYACSSYKQDNGDSVRLLLEAGADMDAADRVRHAKFICQRDSEDFDNVCFI